MVLLGSTLASAIPARRTPIDGFMADGTPVKAVLHGDENFHYYVSEADGALLLRRGDAFVYADVASDGHLDAVDSPVIARRRAAALDGAATTSRRRVPGLVEGTTFPARGKQKIAVVLVQYQDVKFNLEYPLDYFTRMLNQEGFSDYRATGSARDWFINSSGGQFEPEFVVMGPVTLQKHQAFYGGNDAYGQDLAPQKMVIEACRALNPDIDFSQFDCDHDGYIDNVFVVYAGRGEASGGGADCVWPHAWNLTAAEPGQSYIFDGVRLNRYACSNEWELSDQGYGYRPVGIGTFVHEFSHVMGLPDVYSTRYVEGSFTAGAWSALDYGPYNNDGCTPPQYSAWERAVLHYSTPVPLSASAANFSLDTPESNRACIIETENPNEYFVLEHRVQEGWDAYIPGHGMLVWHIDYDADVWSANSANNDVNHNRIDIIEADGILSNATRDGDSFPGAAGVTSFSSTTSPALVDWSGKGTGHSLTDITELDADKPRLAFRVNGGSPDIAAPANLEVTMSTPTSFGVSWTAPAGAIGYWWTLYDADMKPLKKEYIATTSTSYYFEDLTPATDYYYTIKADDGFLGSATSEPLKARTDDPTLDLLAPEVLPPTDIKPDSFTVNWKPLEGATEYYVWTYEQGTSEGMLEWTSFDNGVENLPEGWDSSSKISYGMSAYCGEAAPSLRMASDGDYLSISMYDYLYVTSLGFWHRGNGTTEAEKLVIEGDKGDGVWHEIERKSITTEKGGESLNFGFPYYIWKKVRICFERPSKGAVAIDDVVASFGFPIYFEDEQYIVPAGITSYTFENLESGHTYRYSVQASDGTLLSKQSPIYEVETKQADGIDAPGASVRFELRGLEIVTATDIEVYDLAGRCVATGSGSVTLPCAGVYIIKAKGCVPAKVLAKSL